MSEPLVISFFTDDWEYPQHARRMRRDCESLKLEHHIERRDSTHNYIKNTTIKPFFIRDCLNKFQRPVLWVDVDGVLLKQPGLKNIDADFAACEYFNKQNLDRDWAVGILWFNYTPEAIALLDKWCSQATDKTDEAAFDIAWKKLKDILKVYTLPPKYHFIKWRVSLEIPEDTIFYNQLSKFEDKLKRKNLKTDKINEPILSLPKIKIQPASETKTEVPKLTGPINVISLKWGNKYGSEYVNRLYAAIKRQTTIDFKFWCFTDTNDGIRPEINVEYLKYSTELDSWWNKLNLFSQDLPIPLGERIFYIDLDTLITNNIDDLLSIDPCKIIVLKDFYYGIAKTAGKVASGLMSWKHGNYDFIWQEFKKDPESAMRSVRPHGDQAWVERCVINSCEYWQDLFPQKIVSFKISCNRGLPNNASVVCYHGKPSIPESITNYTNDWRWHLDPQPWVADYWKE